MNIEEIILNMAELVFEKRRLERENQILREKIEKYEEEVDQQLVNAQNNVARILNAAIEKCINE